MAVKKAATKKVQKAPVQQRPAGPQGQPQQPAMSNEQYMLNVMTDRCKALEGQLLQLVQELTRMKNEYEPDGPKEEKKPKGKVDPKDNQSEGKK